MLYSRLIKDNTLYISLHAEQIYQNFNRFDENLGFFTSELTRDTLDRILVELRKLNNVSFVVIDNFELDDNSKSTGEIDSIFAHCFNNNISISFIRISESLYEKLKFQNIRSKYRLKERIHKTASNAIYYNYFSNNVFNTTKFDDVLYKLYEDIMFNVKELYIEKRNKIEQPSLSSNVILPKYLNIKKFIEDKELSFLGLYLLCKKVIQKDIIPDLRSKDRPVLVFPSITAGYIASIFAKLTCCNLAYRDHIGPKNKIYRTKEKGIFKDSQSYIIISDVICMGTEIQITKNIIEHEGGKVKAVVSIIYVEVIKTVKDNYVNLIALTKQNNSKIKYTIVTNF